MRLKRIKKEILQISTLFILSIILIGYIVDISTPMYHLEIRKTEENGYGYRILHKNKVIIYQPYIPAINEKKTFSSEKAALSVGQLVLRKLREGENISITTEELHKIGI